MNDKEIADVLNKVEPCGKANVFMLLFRAEDIKKTDVTRFKNLFFKLKVKIEEIKMPKKLKGKKADVLIIDEVVKWK